MPVDTATAEAPETATTTQQPLTAPLNPALQALMERVLPVDGDAPEGDPKPGDKPEATDKPEGTDGQPEPKPEDKTEPSPASDLRLAPDFSAPEKKEEPKPEEIEITDEMIAAEKVPKKQADLIKFRKVFNQMKAENFRLKSAPPPKTDDPGTIDVIEQQKQHITQLSAQLERLNLQAHPLFRQQLVEPREAMLGQAVDVVKEVGGDVEGFERAMALTGKNRIAALDEIVDEIKSPILREKLGRLIDGIDVKDREIAGALKDAKGMSERLRRQETIQRHEQAMQQEKQLLSLLGAARTMLAENLKLEVLNKTDKPGFEWWNEQADQIDANAKKALLEATPEDMAVLAYLGVSAGALRSWAHSERKARLAAEARLAEIEGADPGDLKGERTPEPKGDFAPDADITQVALARLRRGDFKTAA